jgi:hypothetical protein
MDWLFSETEKESGHDGQSLCVAPTSVYEQCDCIMDLLIKQFEEEDGATFSMLFAYTSQPRDMGAGYYYIPSGKLPPWAPRYGVVCSRHIQDNWYAFRTIDSDNPRIESCPEDTQYH